MNKKFSFFTAVCLVLAAQAFAEDPRIKQGAIFESQGNYEMALGEYRSMLAENSSNSVAYLAAANVRVKMKDYAGALANYRLAYKFDPKLSAAYEGAAKVYELLGDKKKAEAERAKDPKNNPVEEAAPAAPAAEPVKAAEAPAKPAEEVKPAAPVAEPVKVAEAPKAEPAKVDPPKPAEKPVEPKAETKPAEPVKTAAPVAEPVKPAAPAEVKPVEKPAESLPTDPFEKGKALFAAGKYADAAPLWREVLKKTPGHAGAYFYAGLTRFELGEYDKAEFNLKKGLEYKEEGNDANYFLACIYQKNNKTDQEKKFLNNYLKKAAPNGKYRRKAENRLAELTAAAKAEEAEIQSPATASSESKEVAKVDAAKPAPAAKTPATLPVTTAETITVEGAISLFKSGDLQGAMQVYKTLLETEQNKDTRSFILLQLGNIYRELRDFNSAVNRYREVVDQFPDTDWAAEAELAIVDANWLRNNEAKLPRRK